MPFGQTGKSYLSRARLPDPYQVHHDRAVPAYLFLTNSHSEMHRLIDGGKGNPILRDARTEGGGAVAAASAQLRSNGNLVLPNFDQI